MIQFVLQIFKNLGLEINDKSVLEGQWVLLYLGVLVDGEQRRFWVPKEKIARIGALLMKLFQQRTDCGRVTLGLLRSVTGYCVSVKLAAPEIMLYLRPGVMEGPEWPLSVSIYVFYLFIYSSFPPCLFLNRVESDFAQSGLSVDDLYSRAIVLFGSTARAS